MTHVVFDLDVHSLGIWLGVDFIVAGGAISIFEQYKVSLMGRFGF